MCKADPLGPPIMASDSGANRAVDAGRHTGAVAQAASEEALNPNEVQMDLQAPPPLAVGPCATPDEPRRGGEEEEEEEEGEEEEEEEEEKEPGGADDPEGCEWTVTQHG